MAMEDKQLRLMVIDELDFEPSLDAANVRVNVQDGVVALTGHVRSYGEKPAARMAAGRVSGVRAVADEIEVRPAEAKRMHDGELARRVLSVIAWDAMVLDAVKVKVEKGWVQLTGAVEWHYQRQAAERAVNKLSGVVGVSNLIELRSRPHAYDVKKAIEEALERTAELEAGNIRVLVQDANKVTLEGSVRAWHERDAAERAAWSAPGVRAVEDRLQVI
jgi:osmotically-inducible protein OsmY